MNKNAKCTILAILFCLMCLLLSTCTDDIAKVLSGEDKSVIIVGKKQA